MSEQKWIFKVVLLNGSQFAGSPRDAMDYLKAYLDNVKRPYGYSILRLEENSMTQIEMDAFNE